MCLEKNKIIYYMLMYGIFFTTSCIRIIEDPAKKYNDEFLSKNYMKIRRYKNKHLKLAENYDIYYRDNKTDLVDTRYYNATDGAKLKKEYRSRKYKEKPEESSNNLEYLDSNLSIYYKNRTLKEVYDFDECGYDCNVNMAYLVDNYKDYSSTVIGFNDINVINKHLYGELSLRKDKNYNYIDGAVLLANFDYIDIMNRVKEELYLEQKNKEQKSKSINTDKLNNIKNKFLNLFNGKK